MMYVRTYVRANVSCALLFQLSQNHTRDLRNVIRTYVIIFGPTRSSPSTYDVSGPGGVPLWALHAPPRAPTYVRMSIRAHVRVSLRQ